MLAKKFRGCLVGGLVGDCLGFPYEGEQKILLPQLQNYFDKIEGPPFKSPAYKYTDDTAMTKSVAASLIENNGFNAQDLASRFVTEYFSDTNRGYGKNIGNVFIKLNNQNLEDIWRPAKEQFNGSGSYGNGGAMRISPVSLFYQNNLDRMLEIASKVTELTHTHLLAVNGAQLQALSVYLVLKYNPGNPFDKKEFLNTILQTIKEIEGKSKRKLVNEQVSYSQQIQEIDKLLCCNPTTDQILDTLGNNVSAIYSVPTALFCFLKAFEPIPNITTDNPFRRTIQYAISLGGDTDTIASMCGAIAGAYYGIDGINENIAAMCENVDFIDNLAMQLYQRVISN